MSETKRPAVVLLSGGLDSATALAEARAAGFDLYALTISYGQRHAVEIEAARRVARAMDVVRHVELAIDLRAFGGSALTADIEVPKDRPHESMAAGDSDHLRPGAEHGVPLPGPGLGRDAGRVRHLRRRQLRGLLGLPRLPPGVSSVRSRRWPIWRPGQASKGRAGSGSTLR